jgi:hypothetical protein
VLTLSVGVRGWKRAGFHWVRELWKSWRCGRRARRLDTIRYESLLGEPLDVVRRTLGVTPLAEAPSGANSATTLTAAAPGV